MDWRAISYCDGERPLIDNTNSQYMWNSCQGGLYHRGLIPWRFSSNSGVTFTDLPTVVASGSENGWNTEGVLNKVNPSIFYRIAQPKVAGIYVKDEIYRSLDRGLTYSAISNFNSTLSSYTNYFVLKAYTPEADGNYLFLHILTDHGLSTEAHRVFKTTIANDIPTNVINSWGEIPIPRNAWLSDIDFDLNDPNIIYFVYGSSESPEQAIGSGMVLVLDNTHNLSKDLTKNLPNTGVGSDALVLEKGSNGGMYLSTDFGVYYTNNKLLADQTGWVPFGTELPHVTGSGMEINYKINKIRIGTFGRGVWEHNLYCPPSYDLVETATYTSNDFKEAEHNITSTSIVNSPRNINYRAGTQIILQPGFRAATGSSFHAFILVIIPEVIVFPRGMTI